MANINDFFFELIEAGISENTANIPVLTDIEWDSIYEMSKKQSVIGVITDGIAKLEDEYRPYRIRLLKFIGLSNMINVRNRLLNSRAREITDIFTRYNFKSCILKGQSVAQLYLNPLSRNPGDIDIWVDGTPKEIIQFVREHFGECKEKPSILHIDAKVFADVEVEVHYRPSFSYDPFIDSKLQHYFKDCAEEQFNNPTRLGFNAPTFNFDAVYSLSHIYRHFIGCGIGLRQIIDYYYILKLLPKEKHKSVLANIKRFGMYNFLGAIEWILNDKLGLERKYLLSPSNEDFGRIVLDEIWKTGNFAQFDERRLNASPLSHYLVMLKRQFITFRYTYRESIFVPFHFIKEYFRKMI